MKKIFAFFISVTMIYATAGAEEGMWLLQDTNGKIREVSKSVVSYDFMGTGSLISPSGLVITNHHVVYSDVFDLSDKQHNYLEDGFWARSMDEELPIPGRSIQILEKTIDVTDEVEKVIASGQVKRGPMMMRRLSGILEKKYTEETGLVASLGVMWRGTKYYMSLYREYKDIRLVAAPPVSIGAFGGDVDNWEWPQHKCDFSMVRIYTAPDGSTAPYARENVPLKSPSYLKVSLKGYDKGSRTIVIGYPGKTDRYASSAKVDFQTYVTLPVIVDVRGKQMDIIKKWMDRDADVRLKYADMFFSLSNAQELYSGEIICYKRFKVADSKREMEKELQEWIDSDSGRKERWGTIIPELKAKYEAITEVERQCGYFRECIARGCKLHPIVSRLHSALQKTAKVRLDNTLQSCRKDYGAIDLRVEKDIFRMCLNEYYAHVSDEYLGNYQKELKAEFNGDTDAIADYIWKESIFTDASKVSDFLSDEQVLIKRKDKCLIDPLLKFMTDQKIVTFNTRKTALQKGVEARELEIQYTKALYSMKEDRKIRQYPDANSTLRVSLGKVCGYSPRDGVNCGWKSTVVGIFEKRNPDEHDFCLKPEWEKALSSLADSKTGVNFLSDNDITGGNSGSPVLNSRGELIGLAFDGNKESLASDTSFTPDYNRCVNVDIRFVIWTLKHYAGLDNILNEISK